MTELTEFAEFFNRERAAPYIMLFDKQTGKTTRVKGQGFVDDLLGMDSFYPEMGFYDEKMISFIWPHELLDYIEERKDRGRDVNSQLLELSTKVKEEDNPILIFVHLKKKS